MKTKITFYLCLFFIISIFAQVKESEIIERDNKGQPKIIKFKETRISSEKQAVNIFLKSQYKAENDVDFKSFSDILIYPNPANSEIIINFDSKFNNAVLTLYNIEGNPIFSKKTTTLQAIIDVSHIVDGIYFIKIHKGTNLVIKQIIIKH